MDVSFFLPLLSGNVMTSCSLELYDNLFICTLDDHRENNRRQDIILVFLVYAMLSSVLWYTSQYS